LALLSEQLECEFCCVSLYLIEMEEYKNNREILKSPEYKRVLEVAVMSSMDAYLLEVQVHNRDEVQGVRVVVVIWITIAVIHPQLDQPAFTGHHVNCMTTWVRYLPLHQMISQLNRHMYCLHQHGCVNAGHPLDVLCL